jgi:O-methyltransferase involved in polyketide biosynthesis
MPPFHDGQIDTSRPSQARVTDYLLGGKDNFAADRAMADAMLDPVDGYPGLRDLVRDNRRFVCEAVRYAGQRGTGQVIDLGCGLPTGPGAHEFARSVIPSARVAYVDRDPVVLLHVRAMGAHGPGIAAVDADLEDPAAVLKEPALLEVIDLEQPVCLVIAAVLHFMPSPEARDIVAGYAEQLASGSVIAVSAVRYADPELARRMAERYSAAKLENHTAGDLASWLKGLKLIPPGVATARGWRGGWTQCPRPGPAAYVLCAAGLKRLDRSHQRTLGGPLRGDMPPAGRRRDGVQDVRGAEDESLGRAADRVLDGRQTCGQIHERVTCEGAGFAHLPPHPDEGTRLGGRVNGLRHQVAELAL